MAAPKGHKRFGGRTKGTPNKASAAMAAEVAESGLTPVQFMLGVMRDPAAEFNIRLDAAKSVAPYIHPKLSAIEHTGKGGGPMQFENVTDDELWNDIQRLRLEIGRVEGEGDGVSPSVNGTADIPH